MRDAGWTLGAVAGSLVGGLAISALMIAGERSGGEPSELVQLKRESRRRLADAAPSRSGLPDAGEQAATQGGHLVLSALGGLAYAAAVEEDAPAIPSGLAFGLIFYGLAHGLTGPALGVKPAEWREPPSTVVKHVLVHLGFGLLTAAGAKLGRRLSPRLD